MSTATALAQVVPALCWWEAPVQCPRHVVQANGRRSVSLLLEAKPDDRFIEDLQPFEPHVEKGRTEDDIDPRPPCRVAFLEELGTSLANGLKTGSEESGEEVGKFGRAGESTKSIHGFLAADFSSVKFMERSLTDEGQDIYFLDSTSWNLSPMEDALNRKTKELSILFPPLEKWDSTMEALYVEAKELEQSIFIDDGSLATYEMAFADYQYTWILEDRGDSIHPAYVSAMGYFAIPIYSGWVLFTNMFHNSVLRRPISEGSVAELLWQLSWFLEDNELPRLINYHHTILDVLIYRYRSPFPHRLVAAACEMCRLHDTLAIVGIYSAVGNSDKRMAVRSTWGKVLLQMGIRVVFFLGEEGTGDPEKMEQEEQTAYSEGELYRDIVRLPVPEGYRQNARKGIEFLRYMSEKHPDVSFCIKVDDDVYWRPAGLLKALRQRVPFRYIWGFLDLGSPVPREEEDAFFHSHDEWPDDIFPPYPRGVLRVLSMDIVHLLAARLHSLSPSIHGDDPSFGMHLRQLVMNDGHFLQIDDRGAMTRFAMTPTCRTEGIYCPVKNTTWAVHHVDGEMLRCMFATDVEQKYYQLDSREGTWVANEDQDVFPSLCQCTKSA